MWQVYASSPYHLHWPLLSLLMELWELFSLLRSSEHWNGKSNSLTDIGGRHDESDWRQAEVHFRAVIIVAKPSYVSTAIASAESQPVQLFQRVKSLSHLSTSNGGLESAVAHCEPCVTYFVDKIACTCVGLCSGIDITEPRRAREEHSIGRIVLSSHSLMMWTRSWKMYVQPHVHWFLTVLAYKAVRYGFEWLYILFHIPMLPWQKARFPQDWRRP